MTNPTAIATPPAPISATPGWKTSEFWLSALGIAATLFAPSIDTATNSAADRLSSQGAAGAIAAGAIIGAYSIARGLVKAAAARSAAYIAVASPTVVPVPSSSSSSSPTATADSAPAAGK